MIRTTSFEVSYNPVAVLVGRREEAKHHNMIENADQ